MSYNTTSVTPSPKGVEVAAATVVAIGIVTNAWSAYYVAKTFPFRKIAIFFFSLLDSAICLIGCALHLVTFSTSIYNRVLFICVLQNFAMRFQIFSGATITLLIAVTRLASVCLSHKWKQVSEKRAFLVGILVYFVNMMVFFYRLLWKPFFERFLAPINICMGFTGPKPEPDWDDRLVCIWMSVVLQVPLLANGITMIIMRARSMASVKPNNVKVTYAIPLKATLLSAAFFSTYLIVGVFIRSCRYKLSIKTIGDIETVGAAVINTIRCPLTMALSFSAKVRADHESREARQNQVRDWAKKERDKMKNNREPNVP